MNKLIDPDLLQRLEADVKQLINTCHALTQENQVLYEKYNGLQNQHQQLKQRHQTALDYVREAAAELSQHEEIKLDEPNR